jgi:glucose/arabinose dehydrogenase
VYVYYTATADGGIENRLSRFDVGADDPGATEEVLVDGIPANNYHNGGRITFGPYDHLWVTTGDAGEKERAADPSALVGKVLRLTPEGDPAPDNPDLGDDADPRVFTYGHRNPQGIVWLPDGTMVASEHGPTGYDEINRLVAGDDYGWPGVREPDAYRQADDVRPPLTTTGGGNSWAPTGSLFYTGDGLPSWRNRMLVGGLVSQQVVVVTLTPPGQDLPPVAGGERFDADWFDGAYTATAHTVLEDELGRVRHLEQGPDGGAYAVTSNRDGRAKEPFPRERDDVLVRLEPN